MRLSQDTLIMLARCGDDQAIAVLKAVENETAETLLEHEFHFQGTEEQPGVGLFHKVPLRSRKNTVLGMPAFTPERIAALVGAQANRS